MFYFLLGEWRRSRFHYSLPTLLVSLLWVQSALSAAEEPLTLSEATQRVLVNHPELQVFQWRSEAIKGMRRSAELKPAYDFGVEAENLAGSGDFSGTASAEFSLSLSSVIELGDKRSSRVALADSRFALAQAKREAMALDLLGQVTQGFITTLSLQKRLEVAQDATQLAEQSYRLVSARVKSGAAPEADRLRAQALLKQAKLQQNALTAELTSRKFALASLWTAERADFNHVSGDLFKFEELSTFDALYQRVAASPAIQVLTDEERLRDAEIMLARSRSTSNVHWSLGVRRFEGTGDSAFTAGISMPLFSERRNRGEVQSALAEREAARYRSESALIAIRARLFEAWSTYQQSATATQEMRTEVLPALEKALEETRKAYERGRYSYVDWVTAQRELLDARVATIDAATTALLNQALIEQLTAEPLASEPFASGNGQVLDQTTESPRR
jgi:cobalt-zinc-cadmium efflux system outer membrane protein